MSTCGGSRPVVPRCVLSLYYVQKFLFELNRSEEIQTSYWADGRAVLDSYTLTTEEEDALIEPDIGLLFHLGVNGQILMHFAALHQIEWQDYLQRMRDGIETHTAPSEKVSTPSRGTRGRMIQVGVRESPPEVRRRAVRERSWRSDQVEVRGSPPEVRRSSRACLRRGVQPCAGDHRAS